MTRTRCYIHLLVFYICPICSVGTDVQEDTRWQRHSTAVSLSYSQFSTITDTLELEAVLHRYEACHEAVSIKFFVRHVHGSLFRRTPTPHAHKKRLAPHIFTYSPSLNIFLSRCVPLPPPASTCRVCPPPMATTTTKIVPTQSMSSRLPKRQEWRL